MSQSDTTATSRFSLLPGSITRFFLLLIIVLLVIVAVKTFSWHSVQPATLTKLPLAETLVMLITVGATVSTGNLAIGVVAGVIAMGLLPRVIRRKPRATAETASPVQEK